VLAVRILDYIFIYEILYNIILYYGGCGCRRRTWRGNLWNSVAVSNVPLGVYIEDNIRYNILQKTKTGGGGFSAIRLQKRVCRVGAERRSSVHRGPLLWLWRLRLSRYGRSRPVTALRAPRRSYSEIRDAYYNIRQVVLYTIHRTRMTWRDAPC